RIFLLEAWPDQQISDRHHGDHQRNPTLLVVCKRDGNQHPHARCTTWLSRRSNVSSCIFKEISEVAPLAAMGDARSTSTSISGRAAFIICAVLLLIFTLQSWWGVSGKSSTCDEPVHAVGSWLATWHNDYRIDPENPPLWQHWAALPQGPHALEMDFARPDFE